jgi:hypothetical protein
MSPTLIAPLISRAFMQFHALAKNYFPLRNPRFRTGLQSLAKHTQSTKKHIRTCNPEAKNSSSSSFPLLFNSPPSNIVSAPSFQRFRIFSLSLLDQAAPRHPFLPRRLRRYVRHVTPSFRLFSWGLAPVARFRYKNPKENRFRVWARIWPGLVRPGFGRN